MDSNTTGLIELGMRFGVTHTSTPDPAAASEECCRELENLIPSPNAMIIFAAVRDKRDFDEIARVARRKFPEAAAIGCTCQGTITNQYEQEAGVSLTIWGAELKDFDLGASHLSFERTSEGGAFAVSGSSMDTDEPEPGAQCLVALGDPFTFPMDVYLQRLREDTPLLPVIGGMASGATAPGMTRLLCDDQVVNHGAVCLQLRDRLGTARARLATCVSQGCRPIGHPFVVTGAERNEIISLGGKPALAQLNQVFRELPTSEQRMLQGGLHIGIAIDEYRDRFAFGDFLIRNVMGITEESKRIVIADFVRVGQTVQFHVRDHRSASADLKKRLKDLVQAHQPNAVRSGLVFSCNGRGSNLFPEPNHDAMLIRSEVGEIPLAGFFAAGEIGPVGGINFMHGFTCSGLFFCG